MRVAIVASHPVQYQAPWFRALARRIDLDVFFCHRQDAAGQAAAGFGVEFEWDRPLLDGYRSHWPWNRSRRPDVSSFAGCDTPEIGEDLRAGSFDACIVSGWYLKSYLQAIQACKRIGIPILSRGDSQLATSRRALWTAAKYVPYRLLLGALDAHLCVGQANREYLQHYGVPDERLFFVPHFVDNAFFRSIAGVARSDGSRGDVRRRLGIPPDATVFMFAGKFIEKKRPADVLRALAIARCTSRLDLRALFVGAGPLEPALRQAAADSPAVHFAGFQNQSQLPRYYAATDALVLPSDAGETWGLVVNEAMAAGLPAIVSASCGCARDLVHAGRTGFVFPCGDLAALAGCMTDLAAILLADPRALRDAIASKIDRYSLDAAVEGTIAALDVVTARRRRHVPHSELQMIR